MVPTASTSRIISCGVVCECVKTQEAHGMETMVWIGSVRQDTEGVVDFFASRF